MTELEQKVSEAKSKTLMSMRQLSLAIGYGEDYLSAALNRNRKKTTQDKIIALLDELIEKQSKELTHDFQGKALNTQVDDAMMISKSEYESMKKEIDHKTQIAEKHADMRNKAELHVSELEKIVELRDKTISQLILNSGNQVYKINELENKVKSLQKDCLNLTSDNDDLEEKYSIILKKYEKKFEDYWTVSRENIDLINSKRCISIWLAVSILIVVVMLAFGVLNFNGVV